MNDREKIITKNVEEKLSRERLPIYVWGAGSMAIEIDKRLREISATPSGFFYTGEVHAKKPAVSVNYQLVSFESLLAEDTDIAVVIGHGHYEKWKEVANAEHVKRVYMLPNPYLQYTGPDTKYLNNNKERIDVVRNMLSDDLSRKSLDAYIEVRSKNDMGVLLDYHAYTNNIFAPVVDHLPERCIYADIGAWTGDSIIGFVESYGLGYERIVAIEPDAVSCAAMRRNTKSYPRIEVLQCGMGKEKGYFYIDNSGSQSNRILNENNDGKERVEVNTMDDLFFPVQGESEVPNLIKISVPYMFYDILRGGTRLLQKKPCIVVNIAADSEVKGLEVIEFLKRIQPEYDISLRFDFMMSTRLWCYAW